MQVLYLDSIDVGFLNISHDTFPRIRHFTAEIMKTMIMADTIPGKLEAGGFEFGKSQVRRTAMYVVYINKNEQKIEVLCIQISNMLYLKKFLNMTVQRKKYSLLLLGNKLATPIRNTFIINNCWIVGTGFIISTDTWSPSSGMLLT